MYVHVHACVLCVPLWWASVYGTQWHHGHHWWHPCRDLYECISRANTPAANRWTAATPDSKRRMTWEQISVPKASGGPNSSAHISMYGWSAPSYCKSSMPAVYRWNEKEKRLAYEQRTIEVEHGSFTPQVFQQQVAWDKQRLWPTKEWLLSWQRRRGNPTVGPWVGLVVFSISL